MQSFEIHEARTCDAEVNVPDSLAGHAAARFALANDQLDEVWALLVQLMLASVLVDPVYLVVTAAHFDQPLETHGADGPSVFSNAEGQLELTTVHD